MTTAQRDDFDALSGSGPRPRTPQRDVLDGPSKAYIDSAVAGTTYSPTATEDFMLELLQQGGEDAARVIIRMVLSLQKQNDSLRNIRGNSYQAYVEMSAAFHRLENAVRSHRNRRLRHPDTANVVSIDERLWKEVTHET